MLWGVVRFVGLGEVPHAYWMDEAFSSAHAICLVQTGHDADGLPWSLYARACGGGVHPITLLGFNAVWQQIFGMSRAAFRAASAFWILVTCAGLFDIARSICAMMPPSIPGSAESLARKAFPGLTLLVALLSPWSFQFSRIAWEGPLAPAFMVLALAGLARVRARRSRATLWALVTGICGALSTISYPPLRVTTPLVLLVGALLAFFTLPNARLRTRFVWRALLGLVAMLVTAYPMVARIIDGRINSRMNDVAIFSNDWLFKHAGNKPRPLYFFITFIDNLALHLRPSYLFITGDANLRHSAQLIGQLSPLDDLAIVFGLVCLVALVRRALWAGAPAAQGGSRAGGVTRWLLGTMVFAVLGGGLGALPAALTWDGVPHALRSIGSWPFVSLFTGAVLALAWALQQRLRWTIAIVALAYSGYYLPGYFFAYPEYSRREFNSDPYDKLVAARAANPPRPAIEAIKSTLYYGDEVLLYYMMNDMELPCDRAVATLKQLRRR